MLTIDTLLSIVSVVIGCISLGYAIGSTRNRK